MVYGLVNKCQTVGFLLRLKSKGNLFLFLEET
jgi:hypothetical protein